MAQKIQLKKSGPKAPAKVKAATAPAKTAAKKSTAPAKKGPAPKVKVVRVKEDEPKKVGNPINAAAAREMEGKSQKQIVVDSAAKGMTIDQIVERYGLLKTNVSWYFSRLKLAKEQLKQQAKSMKGRATTPEIAKKIKTVPKAAKDLL